MIEFDYVITNGYVDRDTLQKRAKDGWKFVSMVTIQNINPGGWFTRSGTEIDQSKHAYI